LARDKNISPVGWYVGAYLLRFIEVNDPSNEEGEERFLSWKNTVIVKADNMDEAYDKIEKIAQESTEPYLGGADAIPVQWVFEGITEILPIYEELEDGSEIMWAEHKPTKLKNLRKMVRRRGEFVQ
jgi:hypothetical protein